MHLLQILKEGFQKLKYIGDLNTLLLKFLSRKGFDIKKCFVNNNNDLRINEMLCSKVRSGRELLMVKKGLDLIFTVV